MIDWGFWEAAFEGAGAAGLAIGLLSLIIGLPSLLIDIFFGSN